VVGKPIVIYMGDDARNEYIYKFVSKALWDAADVKGHTAGAKYMSEGTLYVAKFNSRRLRHLGGTDLRQERPDRQQRHLRLCRPGRRGDARPHRRRRPSVPPRWTVRNGVPSIR
jgi:hypothetical protein